MLEVDFLPEHLVVIGGSYIGLEFAQMYRRFGSQVTVVKMADRLIPRNDEDVSAAVQEILENKGVQFELGAECLSLARRGTNIEVTSSCGDGPRSVTGTHLLLAVGRVPNTDDLGLEAAGVSYDERMGIVVNDKLQTTNPDVYAVGDVATRYQFTHMADFMARMVIRNALFFGRDKFSNFPSGFEKPDFLNVSLLLCN